MKKNVLLLNNGKVRLTVNNPYNSPWQDEDHNICRFLFRMSPETFPECNV